MFGWLYGKCFSGVGVRCKESNSIRKMGTKRSGLMDGNGLRLSVVLSGANTHAVKLLEETLDHIVIFRLEPNENHPPLGR